MAALKSKCNVFKFERVVYYSCDYNFHINRNREFCARKSANSLSKLFCNDCGKLIYEERNINYITGAKERNDYIQKHSRIMLTNIGYDYNSEFSIHQQFLMKHNLI